MLYFFSLMRTQINMSDNILTSLINDKEIKLIHERSNLSKKIKNIPDVCYVNILNKLRTLYFKYFKNETSKKIIAIDGTNNNVNTLNLEGYLETALNMRYKI